MDMYINLIEVPGTLKSHGPVHKFEGGPKGPWNLMDLHINLKEVPGALKSHVDLHINLNQGQGDPEN